MTSRLVEVDFSPDEATLKRFGFVALAAFGLLAACSFYEVWMFSFGLGRARTTVTCVLAGLGVVTAVLSIVRPKANRLVYVGVSLLTYPIGLVVSHVILAALFFGIFAPMGLVLSLLRIDPMERALRRDRQSYWIAARPPRSKESYFRQF
jgi:hypothetical protein